MKIKPIRWGYALTAAGTLLANMGSISQLNGAKGELIYWCVLIGFLLSVFGVFVTTLHKPSRHDEIMKRRFDKTTTTDPYTDL
jgi:putative exporter of polyketide antibiotics